MFTAIYRWRLTAGMEAQFVDGWERVTRAISATCAQRRLSAARVHGRHLVGLRALAGRGDPRRVQHEELEGRRLMREAVAEDFDDILAVHPAGPVDEPHRSGAAERSSGRPALLATWPFLAGAGRGAVAYVVAWRAPSPSPTRPRTAESVPVAGTASGCQGTGGRAAGACPGATARGGGGKAGRGCQLVAAAVRAGDEVVGSQTAGGRVQPRATHRPSRAARALRCRGVTLSDRASRLWTWPRLSSRTRLILLSHRSASTVVRVAGPVQAAVAQAHSAGTPGCPGKDAATVSETEGGTCSGSGCRSGRTPGPARRRPIRRAGRS